MHRHSLASLLREQPHTSRPGESTIICRLRPVNFSPASSRRSSPCTSVDLTLWLSTIPAVGVDFFPECTRTFSRKRLCRRCQTPASRHRLKTVGTDFHFGSDFGRHRHWQPIRFTDRIAFNTSRWSNGFRPSMERGGSNCRTFCQCLWLKSAGYSFLTAAAPSSLWRNLATESQRCSASLFNTYFEDKL